MAPSLDRLALGSPFRMEWLAPDLARNEKEDVERAVALAAASVLRAARFARTLAEHAGQDTEIRVWLDTAGDGAQVRVWWEPRMGRWWFAVVDAIDDERLGLVVFERVPSVDRAALERDEALFVEALAGAAGGDSWSDVRQSMAAGMVWTESDR